MTDISEAPVIRCAECTCEHGGAYCNWMRPGPEFSWESEARSLRSALIAYETARVEAEAREKRFQAMWEDFYDAFIAMRNTINEAGVPMASCESSLLRGPEMSVECETVAVSVIGKIGELKKCLNGYAVGAGTCGRDGLETDALAAVEISRDNRLRAEGMEMATGLVKAMLPEYGAREPQNGIDQWIDATRRDDARFIRAEAAKLRGEG